ncbi:MAG: hypothetical protein WED09_04225 [Homoserinimonas sp.]
MFGRRKGPGNRLPPGPDAASPAAPSAAASPATEKNEGAGRDRNDLLRSIVVVVGNVTVLSALLVYFGWKRSEVQAKGLGIDESLLGMSTQEYILRSVGSVLVLLIVMALFGMLWVLLDRWLALRLDRYGANDRVYLWVTRLLPAAIVLLPLAAWLGRRWWPEGAYIGFPLLFAAGLLLLLYAFSLRGALPGAIPLPAGTESVLRASTATLIAVALFTAATNYATVEAQQLVRAFERQVPTLPGVEVYSMEPLNIEAPGVDTTQFADEAGYRFRYSGLRLLERVGGQYFLISDEWTRRSGVVVVLKNDEPGVRYEFVRGAS